MFGEQLEKYAHWVNGGRHRAALFTDHRNLLAFFDDKVRPATCTKPNRQRLTRWGLNLRCLRYEIHPIGGEENYMTDIGSRWGNRFAKPTQDGNSEGVSGDPKAMLKAWLGTPTTEPLARRKCALKLPAPKTHNTPKGVDVDADPTLEFKQDKDMLNLTYVREQQDRYRKSRPKTGLKVGAGNVWRTVDGRIWVPRLAKDLKNALYAVAHQGASGHRGKDGTLGILTPLVSWKNMEHEVERRRAQCLSCIKVSNGEMVPRPLGTQLIAERPNEVHMMDYIKIWPSRTGREYVLMQADKMSKLAEFTPTFAPLAVPACRAMLWWASRFGIPEWLISDGGSHFANHALRLVNEKLGVQHHVTLAHCPWSNGAIEVVGKQLLRALRLILSEFKMNLDEWEEAMPVVQYVVNHILRKRLGNRCAVHVITGLEPNTALELAIWVGKKLKDAKSVVTGVDRIEAHCRDLAVAIAIMHEELRDANLAEARRNAAREARNKADGALTFYVGELVMVAAKGNSANVTRRAKPMVKWQGPYEIVQRNRARPSTR